MFFRGNQNQREENVENCNIAKKKKELKGSKNRG
jgi:hypothetical protein